MTNPSDRSRNPTDSKSLATDDVLPAVCNTALSNRLLIREAFDRKRIGGTNLVAKAVEAAEKAISGYLQAEMSGLRQR